ncbi:hypothetical protein QFC20_001709 [Naganishia adeliensis]|uniref:Uncharacterized protein n=1 Tax=Naganishia adeliensis TaxID=92952 RepID=A0ACC2WRT7_9TREE|nr:hypothetical protein QFC20_001709 [Naganishia adeliensis]
MVNGRAGELINDEYEEFISLGLGLRGEAEQLEEIRLPLQVLKNEVEGIRSTFQNAQSGLETLLAERSSLREEKAILDLLIHLTETLERTENLLGIRRDEQVDEDDEPEDEFDNIPPEMTSDRRGRGRERSADKIPTDAPIAGTPQNGTPTRPKLSVRIASSTDDIISPNSNLPKRDIKMLRRIANEYTQLIYLTNKAKRENCEYVVVGREGADIERRMETIKTTLHAHLAGAFSETITSLSEASNRATQTHLRQGEVKQGDIEARLMECLEVYEMIGGWREAEEVLRKFVRRKAEKIVTSTALRDREQDRAPPTPFSLTVQTPGNAVSPSGSVSTPFTPTFLGSVQNGAPDTRSASPVSDRSVPNENTNVFEKTLAVTRNGDTMSSENIAGAGQEGFHPVTGPQITYLPESGPGGNLGAIYNALLRYIQLDLWPLVDAANTLRGQTKPHRHRNHDFGMTSELLGSPGSATPTMEPAELSKAEESTGESEEDGFEFMSRVIWTEIGERILSEIGNLVFAAGRVSELHQNYTITHQFLNQLEMLSGSMRSIALIRESEVYHTFGKRWQLPIYFQLRWKEIVVPLEDALSSGVGSAKGTTDGYALPQTLAVVAAAKACWAPSTYIPELGHRFLRLTLQILSRYRTWLEKSVPALYESSAAATGTTNGSVAAVRQGANISRSTTPQPTAPATLPAGDPSTDPASAIAEDNILRISSMVAFDLIQLRNSMADFWRERIALELEAYLDDADMGQVNAAMQQSLDALKMMFDAPSTQIQQILIRRCTDPLKLVRSVASQIRATAPAATQKMPEPSHFISSILKPLREYFAAGGLGEGLDEELSRAWIRAIVSEVVASYTSILVSVRKTEDLLRRHRKGKKAGFSLFASSSSNSGPSVEEEEQRFKQQMTADIMALAKEIEKLGISLETTEPSEIPGWTALIDVADGKGVDVAVT